MQVIKTVLSVRVTRGPHSLYSENDMKKYSVLAVLSVCWHRQAGSPLTLLSRSPSVSLESLRTLLLLKPLILF